VRVCGEGCPTNEEYDMSNETINSLADEMIKPAETVERIADNIRQFGELRLQGVEPEPPRNADDDTLNEIKAVAKQYPHGGVEVRDMIGNWCRANPHDRCFLNGTTVELDAWRITAKHSDRFEPECMDFETWARAAIGRGLVLRSTQYGIIGYSHGISGNVLVTYIPNTQKDVEWNIASCNCGDDSWAAITRAQYEQETRTKDQAAPDVASVKATTKSGEEVWVPLGDFVATLAEAMQS